MQTNGDTSGDRSATGRANRHRFGQRYGIPDAAKVLGLTEEAVRQRVKRGTLDSTKIGGSLFVLLDTDVSSDTSYDRTNDQNQPVGAGSIDTSNDLSNDTSNDLSNDTSRLVETLEDEVAHLRRQLDQANERDRENRRIIAALTSRIPQLEPGETPGEHGGASEGEAGTDTPDEDAGQPRRSWWRRWFGAG